MAKEFDEDISRALSKCFFGRLSSRKYHQGLTFVMANTLLDVSSALARDARMAAKDHHFGPWLIDFISHYTFDAFSMHALSLVDWNLVRMVLKGDVNLTSIEFDNTRIVVFS